MKSIFLKYHLDHAMGFLLIFGVVSTGYINLSPKSGLTLSHAFIMGGSYVIGTALPFYLSRNYLVPKLLYKKKNWQFVVSLSAIIIVAAFLLYLIAWIMLMDSSPVVKRQFFNPVSIIFNVLFFAAFPSITGTAFFILGDQIRTRINYEKALKEKKETELEYLKSQINPHFLFNAINTMYFQVDESVPDAKKTMVQFSEMLRYQLYECSVDYIDIGKEITYLKNYLSLQLLRKESNVEASFEHEGVEKIKIAPLLLIPLVENAFKHLSNYDDKFNRVDIEMGFKNKMLSVTISNTFEATNSTVIPEYSGGIGLNNVRKRLSLIYPGRHNLSVSKKDNVFIVKLDVEYE